MRVGEFCATVLLLTGSLAACDGPAREAGCKVPPDEGALLEAYAGDPVFDVRPYGAQPRDGVERSKGCARRNREEVSNTSVWVLFVTTRTITASQLREIYDPVATAAGWRAYRMDGVPDPLGTRLDYCRTVRGTVSLLYVMTQPPESVDVRPSNADRPSEPVWEVLPGNVSVGIYAAPERTACP